MLIRVHNLTALHEFNFWLSLDLLRILVLFEAFRIVHLLLALMRREPALLAALTRVHHSHFSNDDSVLMLLHLRIGYLPQQPLRRYLASVHRLSSLDIVVENVLL